MAIHVSMVSEEYCIIQLHIGKNWDWEELAQATYRAYEMKAQYLGHGILVLDMRDVYRYKLGIVAHARDLFACNNQHFAKVVFIGASYEYKALIMMAQQMTKARHKLPDIHFIADPEQLPHISALLS